MEFDYSKIEPIREFIPPKKRQSRLHYGFHGYFTTQPFNVVSEYIKNFSRKGDLVADMFVGAGITATEALRNGRRIFALDLNPFAMFLSRAKCLPCDINRLQAFFNIISSKCKQKCLKVETMSDGEVKRLKIPFDYPKEVHLPSDSDVEYLDLLFTNKQLYQHSLIKSEIDKLPNCIEKKLLLVLFCGTISRANLAYSPPDDGRTIFSGDFTIFHTGRYQIPRKIVEIPVWEVFERRFKNIVEAKKESNLQIGDFALESGRYEVGSATDLKPFLKDASVDYIYTDPPYGAHFKYLDLSTIYNAWLGLEVMDEMRKLEVIEGGELNKFRDDYISLLEKSFMEYR